MLIHEIVLQGVPGSPGMSRLAIGQGITVLVPVAGQPLPLARLLAHILYDESVEPPRDLVAPGAEAARAGLTLQDPAGRVYRILRDLKRGSVQLLSLDPQTKQFTQVSNRAAEVGQFLRAQGQVPSLDLIEGIFTLHAGQFPSRSLGEDAASEAGPATSPFGGGGGGGGLGGRTMTPPGGTPAPRGLPPAADHYPGHGGGNDPGAPPPSAGMDLHSGQSREEIEKRLAELEAQASSATELDEVQFEMDGLQQKVDGIDQQLSSVRELEVKVEELDRQLQQYGDLKALPDDFSSKVQGYGASVDRRDRALERVESERDSYDEHAAVPELPLVRSPIFLGGLAGGLLFFALSVATEWRGLAMLAPIGLGAMVFALLRHLDGLEDHSGLGRRLTSLDDREEKAVRSFDLETSLVRRTMEQVGAESPEELLTRLGQRSVAIATREGTATQLAELQGSADAQARTAERAQHQARIDELDAKLLASGGFAQDPADLRREIEGLQASLAQLDGAGGGGHEAPPSGGEPGFGAMGGGSFEATPPGMGAPPGAAPTAASPSTPDAPANPGPGLIALLADVLHRPSGELLGVVTPRLSQYVAALSQGRWRGASFVGTADIQIDEATGPSLSWESLTPADRDLAYLGLRLTVAELAVRQSANPLVLDQPLLGSAPQALVLKMLAALGGVTQVVIQSPDPAWQQAATQVHPLGG